MSETVPETICPDCGKPIVLGQSFAVSCGIDRESVKVHRRCAKLSTAHGKVVTAADDHALLSIALSKIKRLEERVNDLEATTRMHGNSIDFRVG